MLDLSAKGCHNINLVTPSHFLPWILEALNIAAGRGLELPIVYNCGGYESSEVLGLLKNVVDIYLPDMKYGEAFNAAMYSNAPDYVPVNRAAIREMLRQAGPLKCDENGIAYRGLIIRHLVLPGNAAGSSAVMSFLKESFDPHDIHMSIMAQYRPLYRAEEYEVLNRQVLAEEYDPIREAFINEGFEGYFQEAEKLDTSFVIDFQKRKFEELTGR
jgi:putative pyruvate formate lyase activating enzyme